MKYLTFSELAKKRPSVVVIREEHGKCSCCVVNIRTRSNIDSLGEGSERAKRGRKIAYTTESLALGMKPRSLTIKTKTREGVMEIMTKHKRSPQRCWSTAGGKRCNYNWCLIRSFWDLICQASQDVIIGGHHGNK